MIIVSWSRHISNSMKQKFGLPLLPGTLTLLHVLHCIFYLQPHFDIVIHLDKSTFNIPSATVLVLCRAMESEAEELYSQLCQPIFFLVCFMYFVKGIVLAPSNTSGIQGCLTISATSTCQLPPLLHCIAAIISFHLRPPLSIHNSQESNVKI